MAVENQESPQWAQDSFEEREREWLHRVASENQKRRRGNAPGARYWALLMALALLVVGLGAYILGSRSGNEGSVTADPVAQTDEAAAPSDADASTSPTTAFSLPDPSDLPQGEPEDRMSLLIESSAAESADGVPAATATIRPDGLLYFEGAFRSQDEADYYVNRASDVFGAEAVIEEYTIDEGAPPPAAANVALDKPVLFETGSAVIHPDYIPFLEACEGVLKANPDIKLSVEAFTDSVGGEDFNLELSRARAQAIVDFYASSGIEADRLIGTGFGEGIPIADNQTEAGRQANRRAMLELLGVMGEPGPIGTDSDG